MLEGSKSLWVQDMESRFVSAIFLIRSVMRKSFSGVSYRLIHFKNKKLGDGKGTSQFPVDVFVVRNSVYMC